VKLTGEQLALLRELSHGPEGLGRHDLDCWWCRRFEPVPAHVRHLEISGLLERFSEAGEPFWFQPTMEGQLMASTILMDPAGRLVSTEGAADLHGFAAGLGLARKWFQDTGRAALHPYFDLTNNMVRQRALMAGARLVGSRELVTRAWWVKNKTAGHYGRRREQGE